MRWLTLVFYRWSICSDKLRSTRRSKIVRAAFSLNVAQHDCFWYNIAPMMLTRICSWLTRKHQWCPLEFIYYEKQFFSSSNTIARFTVKTIQINKSTKCTVMKYHALQKKQQQGLKEKDLVWDLGTKLVLKAYGKISSTFTHVHCSTNSSKN